MTYEEFKTAYTKAFASMISYTCNQAGSEYYADKMAELADAYPEWAEEVEDAA